MKKKAIKRVKKKGYKPVRNEWYHRGKCHCWVNRWVDENEQI